MLFFRLVNNYLLFTPIEYHPSLYSDEIACEEGIDQRSRGMIAVVAYLHDINNHKYDYNKNLELKMRHFLSGFYMQDDVKLIMRIISCISFSKEDRYQKEFGVVRCTNSKKNTRTL